jgi:hypothetical protein
MSLEQYNAILHDETSIRILNFCKIPKTTDEINNEIWNYLHKQYPAMYMEKSSVDRIVAPRLSNLEDIGALQYSEGKWKSTQDATDILSKYFGIKF